MAACPEAQFLLPGTVRIILAPGVLQDLSLYASPDHRVQWVYNWRNGRGTHLGTKVWLRCGLHMCLYIVAHEELWRSGVAHFLVSPD